MTAILALNLGDRVVMMSDSARCLPEGPLAELAPKLEVVPGIPAVVALQGPDNARQFLAWLDRQRRPFQSVADLMARFGAELKNYWSSVYLGSPRALGNYDADTFFRCIVAAVGDDGPVIAMLHGREEDPLRPADVPAFTFHPVPGPWLAVGPPILDPSVYRADWFVEWRSGAAAPTEQHCVSLFEAWRKSQTQTAGGYPAIFCIGGDLEEATITAAGVERRVIHSWPDAIGKSIDPFGALPIEPDRAYLAGYGISDAPTLTGSETLTNKVIVQPVLTLEQGASVAPTTEGRIAWDTDDDKLKVGTGSGTKTFSPDDAGIFQPLISFPPQGRLSLTSATPVTESDVTGATTIYCVPCSGQHVPVYDGAALAYKSLGSQISLPLDSNSGHTNYHESGKNFDLFAIVDSGTLKLATGPKWNNGASAGSDTARGTGAGSTELEAFAGLLVNKNSMTARVGSASGDTVTVAARSATYLGTFRCTANGQATDSKLKRLLFNAYNQTLRPMYVRDTALTWNYSTDAWRQVNANSAFQLELLLGLSGIVVTAQHNHMASGSTSTGRRAQCAIGLDSTSAIAPGSLTGFMVVDNNAGAKGFTSRFEGFPGLGFHTLTALERGAGVDTQSWYGTNSDAGNWAPGMLGSVLG
jgi:hypothetical protein